MTSLIVGLVAFVLLWFVVAPVLTLLHELGHAAAALMLTRRPVTVILGDCRHRPDLAHVRGAWGRLAFRARLPSGWVGFCDRDDQALSSRRAATIVLSGPAASLALALELSVVANGLRDAPPLVQTVSVWAAFGALLQFLATIVPWRYPRWWGGGAYGGIASDGLWAWRLLREGGAADA